MRLRNSADYRTLLWVAMAGALVLLQFNWPQTVLYVLPFSCYLAIACGTIAHNHNHCPTFDSKRANNVFGHVLTIFYVWFFSLVVPAFCSVTVIMFFNYIQHVHADGGSEHDHSRNFTSKIFNFCFFNNGYHTAHHDHPGLHWSELPAAHGKIAHTIDPRLNEPGLAWYLIRQYLLAPFLPRLGTSQIGPEPGGVEIVVVTSPSDEESSPMPAEEAPQRWRESSPWPLLKEE